MGVFELQWVVLRKCVFVWLICCVMVVCDVSAVSQQQRIVVVLWTCVSSEQRFGCVVRLHLWSFVWQLQR